MIGQCWSCPWRDTDFYRLSNDILTAIKFQYEILGPIVRLYVGAVGPGLNPGALQHPASCAETMLAVPTAPF